MITINKKKLIIDLCLCILPTLIVLGMIILYLSVLKIIFITMVSLFITIVILQLSDGLQNFLDLIGLKNKMVIDGKLLKNESYLGSRGVPYYCPVVEFSSNDKKCIIQLEKYKYRNPLLEGSHLLLLVDLNDPESVVIAILNPYLHSL